jgi:serine/threonine-protein kinase
MPILSVCSSGGLPYLVMPFVACESLQQRLDRDGALDVVDVLRIGMQTARGLAAAHAQGLVHRDVKPANILLEKGVDRVLLTDFGLARAADDATLTRSGVIAGTPQFMSPEQAKGEPVDARSDLFSLGSVLYAACAGRPPFRAESTYGILRRITDSPARSLREIDPRVPDWLEGIVVRLHAKEPGQRFPSADEVADLLERCVAHVQQPATPLPGGLRPPQRRFFTTRRSIRRVAATAAVLVAAAVAAVVLNWFHADVDPHDAPSAGISVPANSNVFVPSNSEGMESQSDDRTPSWDDGIGQALDGIRRDLDRIEAEAGPLPDGSQLETGHGQGMK